MTFLRLDDRFLMGKARAWGVKGRSLYLAGLCFCNRELTDGAIPKNMVAVLLAEAEVDKATIKTLVAAGVWVDEGDRYRVHDYLAHQRSREQVLRERATWRRQKQGQKTDTDSDSTGGSDDVPPVESTAESTADSAQLPPPPEVRGERSEVDAVTSPNGSSSPALRVLPNETKTNTRTPARKAAR